MEIEKEKLATTTFKKKMSLLEKLFAGIGDKPISEIVPTDILAVIRPIEACGKNETAHALAQNAGQVFTFARTCGYCMFNAADSLSKVLKPCKVRHLPCLTDLEKLASFYAILTNIAALSA